MKIKFLYKNKLLAKQYFEKKKDIDSDFKSLAVSAYLLFQNVVTLYFIAAIIWPDFHETFISFFKKLDLPYFVEYLIVCALFLGFIKCIKGKPEWNVISTKERNLNRLYVICSFLSLPVTYILIFRFKW